MSAFYADKLRATADWFEDCKTLTLEQVPTGLIRALRAGADALDPLVGKRDEVSMEQALPVKSEAS